MSYLMCYALYHAKCFYLYYKTMQSMTLEEKHAVMQSYPKWDINTKCIKTKCPTPNSDIIWSLAWSKNYSSWWIMFTNKFSAYMHEM